MKLVICEKPSVGAAIAAALGVKNRKDGYFENDEYIIHSPFVSRINSERNQSNHLVGISNSIVVSQFTEFIVFIIPLR